ALNHEIVPGHETAQDQGELVADKEVTALLQSIARSQKDLAGLLALWKEREQEPAREVWSRTSLPYRQLGERLLGVGAPGLAHDVVVEGLDPEPEKKRWPTDVRLRQLQALALARIGSAERAQQILE